MEFYKNHGDEFSRTRFRIWPCVKKFLAALPSGAQVLDIGCGNGKNMAVRPDLQTIGLESSGALCAICVERGLSVVHGDARSLPFRNGAFDAVIMIAVLHHLPPEEHPRVFTEIARVLRPGGTALITNWAVEQPEGARRQFTVGLNMVEWKGCEGAPLPYWVMDSELASETCASLPSTLACGALELEAGNWVFTLARGQN